MKKYLYMGKSYDHNYKTGKIRITFDNNSKIYFKEHKWYDLRRKEAYISRPFKVSDFRVSRRFVFYRTKRQLIRIMKKLRAEQYE